MSGQDVGGFQPAAEADKVDEAERASFDRRYREMLSAGLDLLDQGVTVFDADLRLVAWNKTFLQLLDFPESLARPGAGFETFIRYNAER
ncbi:MAG: hypothetical protein E6Q50_18475, partial [Lysobacter sp.]